MKDVSYIFNKFAGREVGVTEKVVKVAGYTFNEAYLKEPDPVIEEMETAAKANGLTLRVHLPGQASTCDFWTNRVNASIVKGADGKWRVGSSFGIG